MRQIALIIFLLSSVTYQALAQDQNSVEGDRQALVELYNATNGGSWNNNSGWLSGNPSNDWYGVEVNSNGRVVKLDLYKNNLEGTLPSSVGNLTELRFLSFKGNSTLGEIPASIANWTKAEILLFASDQLNTPHNMPNENNYNDHMGKNYNVTRSKYTGKIPDVFDNMPNLRMLQLAWQDNMDEQLFPSTLYQHDKLEILELQGAMLKGTLSDRFNLPELRRLGLGNSQLEGSIPSSLGNSTKVITFSMSHNDSWLNDNPNAKKFTGELPASFSNFEEVRVFYLINQDLSGELPSDIFLGWDNLQQLSLDHNNFTGTIPPEFGDKNMVTFRMAYNELSGELHPNLVSGMPNVIIFDVRGNNLSGSVHPELWKTKTRLRSLNLALNNFTGGLPDAPDYVGDVAGFWLYGNQFSGGIPDSWENLLNVDKLNEDSRRTLLTIQVQDNLLEGVIPAWFTQIEVDGNTVTPGVNNNKWTHKDILENNPTLAWGFWPPGIKTFGSKVNQAISEGSTFTYDYSGKVHSTDQIQWTKDGSPISGATSPILRIENFDFSDEGIYRLELTNDGVPPVGSSSGTSTIVSEPIDLRIGESGGESDSPPATPTLSSPSNGSSDVSTSPQLSWNSVSGAESYRLQVSKSSGFSSTVVSENGITSTQRQVSGLDYETKYYWRVLAVNGNGASEWSSVAEFTTKAEDGGNGNNGKGPQKSTPAKDEKKVSKKTTFKWESVEDAESYTIEISEATTSTLFVTEDVTDTLYVSAREMKGNTEYVWRVRATVQGQPGEWSDEWEFTTTDENEETALEVELSQNYPNPFNPSTNIRFTINEQQDVSLKVYDMAGRLVANLIDGSTFSAGTHNASFNANSLASGIYFYRLITPSEIVTRKMTLMK
jgi:hypothetical protein